MKAIILAAGMGTRLRPLTNERPKALVPLQGRPLIEYQLNVLKKCGITDITIVAGYLYEQFIPYGYPVVVNSEYESTNMLFSLFKAADAMKSNCDLLICYGDIIYEESILKKLINSDNHLTVSADLDWYNLWKSRMEDPLSDAESFIYDEDNKVLDIGKKVDSLDQAQAQYMGLIKCSSSYIDKFKDMYYRLAESDVRSMYMTDFLRYFVDTNDGLFASLHHGKWLEVDSLDDLKFYEKSFHFKEL